MDPRKHFSPALLLTVITLGSAAAPSAWGQVTAKTISRGKPIITSDTSGTSSVSSVPVGYIQLVISPATDSSTPSTQVFSVPFYNSPVFAALVTSVDTSTAFSNSAATWATNQFAQTGSPYLVHFNSGNSAGRYFLIQSNTASQINVYARAYDLTTAIAASDSFEILPANTLGGLFGSSSVPFLTGASAAVADNLYLWNGSNYDIYYHNGTNWKRGGSLLNQNNTIIYPDEGLSILRRSTAALTLTFLGTVPSTTERSDLPGPGSTFVANRFPMDTMLGSLGIQAMPNWISGTSAATADNISVWNGSAWLIYYYNGTHWKRGGSLNTFDTLAVPAGSAVFVTRQSTASGAAGTLVQALPYSL